LNAFASTYALEDGSSETASIMDLLDLGLHGLSLLRGQVLPREVTLSVEDLVTPLYFSGGSQDVSLLPNGLSFPQIPSSDA
jgi:hypothetical protein